MPLVFVCYLKKLDIEILGKVFRTLDLQLCKKTWKHLLSQTVNFIEFI